MARLVDLVFDLGFKGKGKIIFKMGNPKSYHVLDLFALPPGCAKMEEEDRRKLVIPTQPRRTAMIPKTCRIPISFGAKGISLPADRGSASPL